VCPDSKGPYICIPLLHGLALSTNLNNISKKDSEMDKEAKDRIAAQLATASKGLISVPQAMKAAGFPTPDRKNSTLIKRVWRRSKDLVVVDQKSRSGDSTSKTVSNEPQPARIEGQTVERFQE